MPRLGELCNRSVITYVLLLKWFWLLLKLIILNWLWQMNMHVEVFSVYPMTMWETSQSLKFTYRYNLECFMYMSYFSATWVQFPNIEVLTILLHLKIVTILRVKYVTRRIHGKERVDLLWFSWHIFTFEFL